MPTDRHTAHKALIATLRAALYDFDERGVRAALAKTFAPDAVVRLGEPIGEMVGPDAFYGSALAPLVTAMPDVERRDTIVVAGTTPQGNDWVGCAGAYLGTFQRPWMDIPPTGHVATVRFHEFFRIVDGAVTEVQALWDLPAIMMQAAAWPMAPSLGREMDIPGPATNDGIVPGPYDAQASQRSCQHIIDMLTALKRHPADGGPEVMEMERYWHPRFNWYGPAGIGTGRGVRGFRHWHQIPFLNAMPDRGQYVDDIVYHFFGDRNYAAVTGWPNMIQTLTHDGWMGVAPTGQRITMRSLDFWRMEDGLIRENWVMVDLIDAYRQLGVDVFGRMREFNKARQGFDPESGRALP